MRLYRKAYSLIGSLNIHMLMISYKGNLKCECNLQWLEIHEKKQVAMYHSTLKCAKANNKPLRGSTYWVPMDEWITLISPSQIPMIVISNSPNSIKYVNKGMNWMMSPCAMWSSWNIVPLAIKLKSFAMSTWKTT